MRPPALLFLLALSALPVAGLSTWSPLANADEVTIYRCTDTRGKLTLRDTPCAKGEQQQVRAMLRPKDAPARPVPPARPPVAAAAPPQRIVFLSAPRPLYDCVRPDGSVYSSDTGEGAPRWVPLWTLGYPVAYTSLSLGDRIGAPSPRPRRDRAGPPRHVGHPGYVHPAAGTWVRDECHALPPAEVCSRLVDRRDELRRRFFNAMPSERATLTTEERGLNARLDNDCGGSH